MSAQPQLSYRLSREELLLLLALVKAKEIPGLDPDPLGDKLTKEQRAIGYVHAERSLRAREFARIGAKGSLQVDQRLLLAAATCAFPERMILAYHVPHRSLPVRYFGHIRRGVSVLHSKDMQPLHDLSFFRTPQEMIAKMVESCGLQTTKPSQAGSFVIPNDRVAQVRQAAETGKSSKARRLLESAGVEKSAARDFAGLLGDEHSLTVIQVIRIEDKEVLLESMTVAASGASAWVMTAADEENRIFKPFSAHDLPGELFEKLEFDPLTRKVFELKKQ